MQAVERLLDEQLERNEAEEALAGISDEELMAALAEMLAEVQGEGSGHRRSTPVGQRGRGFEDVSDAELLDAIKEVRDEVRRRQGWVVRHGILVPPPKPPREPQGKSEPPPIEPHPVELPGPEPGPRPEPLTEEELTPQQRRELEQHEAMAEEIRRVNERREREAEPDWRIMKKYVHEPMTSEPTWRVHNPRRSET
jgi:hypothetical protein